MANFKHNLRDRVKLVESGEEGQIIGRAEYDGETNNYYIRYVAADGRLVKEWFVARDFEAAK